MANGRTFSGPKFRGMVTQKIYVAPTHNPDERKCKACGTKTLTPLRNWCEACRLSLTPDEKRAYYGKI